MIYRINITEQAEEDIRSIFEYIAYNLRAPRNARGQLERIEKSIYNLEQMLERFPIYDREPWSSRGFRIMPVNNFCVFYYVDSMEMKVVIIRVMYGACDIDRKLE